MLEVTKISIYTRFKTADSRSDSDFTIELPKTINIPEDTICYINDIVLPVSWTTIDERNNKLYYSISHYVNGKYDTSYWILPSDLRNYNGTTLAEGFGYNDDMDQVQYLGDLPGIFQGQYQTVMVKPLCGLFDQAKYLPLRYMPIELELELADWDAPIITDFSPVAAPVEGGPPEKFSSANTSTSWCIQTFQIKCDILALDNSLDNSYVNHLLGDNTLNMCMILMSLQCKV